VIDLHLHTTASDGRCTPDDLVDKAHAAGVTVMAVTDHDTLSGIPAARAAADARGITCYTGIEVSAVHQGRDVHVLGYFVDPDEPALRSFLAEQRHDRRRRLDEILERLARLGLPIDAAPLRRAAEDGSRSIGRPLIAAALVAAGHARDIQDAFDRLLAEGRPAFVVRQGRPPADVIALLHGAHGLVSLAHPGKLKLDAIIPSLADQGLDAIEAFHPDHNDDDVLRYLGMARDHKLAVTGGSDYHGPGSGRADALGRVGLPADQLDALLARRGV
jgi:predicted metal-dependent phosphoesterase TrpH